jgi:hypothetical protein
MMLPNDTELLQRVRERDPAAFRILIRRHDRSQGDNNAGVQSPAVETADASGEEFDRVNAIIFAASGTA